MGREWLPGPAQGRPLRAIGAFAHEPGCQKLTPIPMSSKTCAFMIYFAPMEQNVIDIQLDTNVAEKQLATAIESLLFVSGRPLERAELRKLLNVNEARLQDALQT